MPNLNSVMLIGNLTREPELHATPKGNNVCEFGIAINRNCTTEGGEKMQETTFLEIVVWGKLADISARYLHKGSSVFIEGRLHQDNWEDKQTGQKRSKIRIVAESLQFLDGKPSGDPSQSPPRERLAKPVPRNLSVPQSSCRDESEIPF